MALKPSSVLNDKESRPSPRASPVNIRTSPTSTSPKYSSRLGMITAPKSSSSIVTSGNAVITTGASLIFSIVSIRVSATDAPYVSLAMTIIST